MSRSRKPVPPSRSRPPAALEGIAGATPRGGGAIDVATEIGPVRVVGALPRERVRVTDLSRAGGAWHARIVEVLEPSEDRVASPCPKQDRCGGCPWLVASGETQHRWLRAMLAGAIRRAGGGRIDVAVVPSPSAFGYRRRARFHVEAGAIGYRARRDHAIVAPDECVVLAPPLRAALPRTIELAACIEATATWVLAVGPEDRPVLGIETESKQPVELYRAVEDAVTGGDFVGAVLRVEGAAARFGDPREAWPGDDGQPMLAPLGSFAQANAEVNRALVEHVRREANPTGMRVLELFAGAGNLTVPLAREAREVVAVERDREAVEAARRNLETRGLRARLVAAEAADAPARRYDVVVLDPPRAGAGEAIAAVLSAEAARVVYVSCHVASLGRDLGELVRAGYVVESAAAFEMFPGTGHVESVVTLTRV